MLLTILLLVLMSKKRKVVKKVVHRIVPKQQQPMIVPKTQDAEKLEEAANAPKIVNSRYFQQQLTEANDVEDEWGASIGAVVVSGRRNILVGLLVLAAFFLVCAIWGGMLINGGTEVKSRAADPVEEELSFEEKLEIRNATIVAYLSAATLEEKALHVRDPERVIPLMTKYYNEFPLLPEQARERLVETPVMGNDKVLWRVRARDKETHGSIYLLVETKEDGTSLVDWETDVVFQPSSWSEFKATKSIDPHVFRAMVQTAQLDGFHGFEFAEYNKFRCFKVTLPGSDDYLWAYTEIGSKEDVKMLNIMTSGGRRDINAMRAVPLILELRYPENGQSARCVHLSRLVQAGWLQ